MSPAAHTVFRVTPCGHGCYAMVFQMVGSQGTGLRLAGGRSPWYTTAAQLGAV